MKNHVKGKILKGVAIALDVGVPLGVTLSNFPVWVDRSAGATVSGLSLIIVFLCCIPFYRQLKEYFKSPSAPVLWTVLFVLFLFLENIVHEIKLVCFFGAISNYVGSLLYKIGSSYTDTDNSNSGGENK